jgi:hypothetical protein
VINAELLGFLGEKAVHAKREWLMEFRTANESCRADCKPGRFRPILKHPPV